MFQIVDMTPHHIEAVHAIETRSFTTPWSKNELMRELQNKHAIYKVAAEKEKVAGYAGLWHIVNEGQITNIAVDVLYRRMGVGSMLMEALIALAHEMEMIGLTLEVRAGNTAAQELYKKYGFLPEGIRKNYYKADREDAIIMWKYF